MMRKIILGISLIAFTYFSGLAQDGHSGATSSNSNDLKKEIIKSIVDNIQWFAQASVKIQTQGVTIYIDPYGIEETDEADYILITHAHSDHFSYQDIEKIMTKDTKFIAPADCAEQLKTDSFPNVFEAEIGKEIEFGGLDIRAVPAYNIEKTRFHPKKNNWVGYLLYINTVTIYHPGDTERIPEMKDINCDIAFMCLGQTYTMNTVEDAANAVLDTKAKVAIPFHYGMYEGKKEDAQKFKELLDGKVDVIIK